MPNEDNSEWKPSIAFGHSPVLSDDEILSQAESLRFRYLPAGFDSLGLLKYRFLRTCEVLNIPRDRWPDFGLPEIAVPGRTEIKLPAYLPPPFDVLRDSAETWRKKADHAWSEYCKDRLSKIRKTVGQIAKMGVIIPQKQFRERGKPSPMALRLKWAALHYCLAWSYRKVHLQCNPGGRYSLDAVTKAIRALLKDLGLARSAS